jgi:serine/threonine protein kinase
MQQHDRDDAVAEAIASGQFGTSSDANLEVTRSFAANNKIESLFSALRLPSELAAIAAVDTPTAIGPYRIVKPLGEGGFGVVYLAYDERLGRTVAVKIPRGPRAGLLEDARKAAGLDHHGIVTVHAVGEQDDGSFYAVMEYLEGGSLADRHGSGWQLAFAEAATLIAEVADAVQYAHQNGLVHCDIKPGNILFDREGRPHVSDFGMAVHESEQMALAGSVSGTVPFMAPEVARGEMHRCDGRADIWSLGVTLYELLTGRLPFQGETKEAVFDEIIHRDPRPPRQVNAEIPAELERICLRCLAKDATQRYATAADLANDLRSWIKPRSTLVTRTWILVAAATFVLCVLGVWAAMKAWPRTGEECMSTASAPQQLEGTVDVLVWNPDDETRRGIRLRELGALPLRSGDQIRLTAHVNSPAYLYIIWIDSEGEVLPVHPWTPGRWDELRELEKPARRLSLPHEVGRGWPMGGPPGMETIVLLARETPLPDHLNLLSEVTAGTPLPVQDPRTIVEFVNGEMVTAEQNPNRAPLFFDPQTIEDPVIQAHQHIAEELGPHFSFIRSVSFANRGS